MDASANAVALQRRTVARHARCADAWQFFNVLTGEELLETAEAALPTHRERLFPPTETLSMFLAQALNDDRSCQAVVNESAAQRMVSGLPRCSPHTGAYCRARQRLPVEMVRSLTREAGAWVDRQVKEEWRWQGRAVRLVDGTTVTFPDTSANQQAYPQQGGQAVGVGFPIARLVGITCLSSGALLNAAMGRFQGKGGNEQALLRSLVETFDRGDVLLGDALYATWFLLADLQARGVDVLFEQNGARRRTTDFRTGRRLGSRDHLITLDKPKCCPQWMCPTQYAALPEAITVRELKAGGRVLVTSLVCPQATPKSALKELYKRRWHIELDLRGIKTTLGMETLTCKTPAMVEKELWVYLLAYNLIRMLMMYSARAADVLPRTLSFRHTIQLWLAWTRCGPSCNEMELSYLGILIAQKRVGNRPGRIEPRAVKRRPKQMPLLTKPRAEARRAVLRHGHPRKPK